MESATFWDIMPYIPLKVNQCIRGTCGLWLQAQRLVRNKCEVGSRKRSSDLQKLPGLLFNSEDKGNFKYHLTFSGLHNVRSQKIKIFVKSCSKS
jgi:hypothetical protein